jgi:acyl carrier protein
MTHIGKPDLAEAVIALVADTFDRAADSVTTETQPGDIAGWDSLGHSVLLTRITRRFKVTMTEDLAMPVGTVGELIDHVRNAAGRVNGA